MNKEEYLFDEICPYIREAGMQHQDSWKTLVRRIYDHQFLYCFEGTANAIIEDRCYQISAGDLVLVPPNTPHRFWVDENTQGELYWVHFDFFLFDDREWLVEFYNDSDRYITLFGNQLQYPEHIRINPVFKGGYTLPEYIHIDNKETMEYLFRNIYKNYIQQGRYCTLSVRASFFEIIDSIFKQYNNDPHSGANHTYVANQMKGVIAKKYYRKLSLKDICVDTCLNPEYASKLFQKETGMKVTEYINRFRIGKAKKLLLDLDLSVGDIADMVGFSTENYFCSVMRKYEGKTPEKIRTYLLEPLEEPES